MAEEILPQKKRGRPVGSKNKPKQANPFERPKDEFNTTSKEQKVEEVVEVYDVFCGKCGSGFQSKDKNDLDNEGKCPPCKEKAQKIAENVQKLINQRRANRPTPLPRQEPPTIPGTDYINAKYLL